MSDCNNFMTCRQLSTLKGLVIICTETGRPTASFIDYSRTLTAKSLAEYVSSIL